MKPWFSAAVAVCVTCFPATGQDHPGSIHEAKWKYEKALKKIAGVKDVTVGGKSEDLRLVIQVENNEAKEAVRQLVGDAIDGWKIYFLVSANSGGATSSPASTSAATTPELRCNDSCPIHCRKGPGTTVAEPRKPESTFTNPLSKDPMTECDVMREYSGQGKRKNIKYANSNPIICQQMIGWTNDPGKVDWAQRQGFPVWKSQELPGWHCYTYIKHRAECPLGFKKIVDDIYRLTPK